MAGGDRRPMLPLPGQPEGREGVGRAPAGRRSTSRCRLGRSPPRSCRRAPPPSAALKATDGGLPATIGTPTASHCDRRWVAVTARPRRGHGSPPMVGAGEKGSPARWTIDPAWWVRSRIRTRVHAGLVRSWTKPAQWAGLLMASRPISGGLDGLRQMGQAHFWWGSDPAQAHFGEWVGVDPTRFGSVHLLFTQLGLGSISTWLRPTNHGPWAMFA